MNFMYQFPIYYCEGMKIEENWGKRSPSAIVILYIVAAMEVV